MLASLAVALLAASSAPAAESRLSAKSVDSLARTIAASPLATDVSAFDIGAMTDGLDLPAKSGRSLTARPDKTTSRHLTALYGANQELLAVYLDEHGRAKDGRRARIVSFDLSPGGRIIHAWKTADTVAASKRAELERLLAYWLLGDWRADAKPEKQSLPGAANGGMAADARSACVACQVELAELHRLCAASSGPGSPACGLARAKTCDKPCSGR